MAHQPCCSFHQGLLTTFAASIAAEHAEDGIDVLVVVSNWIKHVVYWLWMTDDDDNVSMIASFTHRFQLLQQCWQDVCSYFGSKDLFTSFSRCRCYLS